MGSRFGQVAACEYDDILPNAASRQPTRHTRWRCCRIRAEVMHPARERSFIDMQCRAAAAPRDQRATAYAAARAVGRNGEAFGRNFRGGWIAAASVAAQLRARHDAGETRPHSPELLQSLGHFLGAMTPRWPTLRHPAARRELKWDLARAGWIRQHLSLLRDVSQRALVEKFLSLYDTEVLPALPQLARRDLRRPPTITTCWWAKRCPCQKSGQPHRSATMQRDGDRVGSAMPGLCHLGKENPLRAAAKWLAVSPAFPLTEAELKILLR